MAVKLKEQTQGAHIFMRLKTDTGHTEEISAYIRGDGWSYETTADNDPELRAEIIKAFHELY